MNTINQDEILRELELLPVWQSRVPAGKVQAVAEEPLVVEAVTPELEPTVVEQTVDVMSGPAVSEAASPAYLFRCMASEDAKWLFVLQQEHSEEAEILLQNMLKSVAVKVGQHIEQADKMAVSQLASSVIVVMGEAVAQQLLSVTEPLTALRGEPHELNGTPVIVTYSAEMLLENLADKSNAWEDLCLAKFTVANM